MQAPIQTLLKLSRTSTNLDEANMYLEKAQALQADRNQMEAVTLGLLAPYPSSWIQTNQTHTNEMTASQMQECYYPLVKAFDQSCYQLGCNNYAFRVIRYFTDLCVQDVNVTDVIQRMDTVCDVHVQRTKCGIE